MEQQSEHLQEYNPYNHKPHPLAYLYLHFSIQFITYLYLQKIC